MECKRACSPLEALMGFADLISHQSPQICSVAPSC